MHTRVIVTESGAAVAVQCVLFDSDKARVEARAREQMRQIIEQVLQDNPDAPCDIDEALGHGYWWADLGSEEFSVLVLEPEKATQLPPSVAATNSHVVVPCSAAREELARQCGLVLDLAEEEVQTRHQAVKDGQASVNGLERARNLEADVDLARPHILAVPQMLGLLSQAVSDWPQFESDEEVSGADLVDWFAQWRQGVKALLAGISDGATADPIANDAAIHATLEKGFVVLTRNEQNKPDSRFEAWAYDGALDFNAAKPLRFGLGASPHQALIALNEQLSELTDEASA